MGNGIESAKQAFTLLSLAKRPKKEGYLRIPPSVSLFGATTGITDELVAPHADVRPPQPAAPGQVERIDYEIDYL